MVILSPGEPRNFTLRQDLIFAQLKSSRGHQDPALSFPSVYRLTIPLPIPHPEFMKKNCDPAEEMAEGEPDYGMKKKKAKKAPPAPTDAEKQAGMMNFFKKKGAKL